VRHSEKWRISVATGQVFEDEARFRRAADGEYRWFLVRGVPLRDQHGNIIKWYGTLTDIEDRKRAEEALQRSEFYLSEGQRFSHMGSWVWQVAGGDALHLSDEWYRIYGFDPKQGMPKWEERLQRVHPEDRDLWQGTIDRAIHERSDYEVEFRILLPDGTLKWVHTVAHAVVSAAGELVQFVGSSMDVTERKRTEDKIREQERELRQMLDLTPQLVAVFGPNRERLCANRVALDYLGLSNEEWLQRSDRNEFFHPDDRERVNDVFDRALSSGSAGEMEFRLRKGNGSYRWFLARYNPVRDEHGQITRWYLAGTDIEDRKRAEERLQQENIALREEVDRTSMSEEIVGASPALQTVLSSISKVAPSDSTVLITGETGTGKELVARAIHRRSRRSGRAFVSVNCAAIPRDLIASELFGHEKGAFTGAMQRRLGRFEMADGGTIFLDEVGELSPETQVALLRVLQEREFERVGGGQAIRVDVRIIAATNRDLKAAVANGTFRQDLFYRLNVFPIEVPPLRERKDDILMLVEYYVQRYANRAGKTIRSIEKKTLDVLQSYDWPGNIRELQNIIERSVILGSGDVVSVDEMWLSKETSPPASRVEATPRLNRDAEQRSEREIIEAALAESRGRVSGPSGAAAKLGIPPSTLDHRIRALKIHKRQFKFTEV
jgi:formate hydrogenlyase transcriptional activator